MGKFWKVLNSNIVLLVLGFLLSGVLGAWLSDRFQEASWQRRSEFEAQRRAYEWKREKTFELLKYRLQEGLQSLENISTSMNRRLFLMEKVFDVARRADRKLSQGLRDDYVNAVEDWNIKLKYYEEDLRRLVGEEFANELNDYETDRYAQIGHCPAAVKDIHSIHGKFWCAHRSLRKLMDCDKCADRKRLINETAALIRELNFQTDAFVGRAGNVFLNRSAELEEFKFTPGSSVPKTPKIN